MNKNFDGNHHYLINDQGKTVGVFLSIEKFEKIMRELEDCRDALAAEQAYEEFTRGRTLDETIDDLLQKK